MLYGVADFKVLILVALNMPYWPLMVPCSRPIRNLRRLFMLVAVMQLMLTAPLPARAQVLYGSLTANITDGSGAAVPGAIVVDLTNTSTGVVTHRKAEANGGINVNAAAPGTGKAGQPFYAKFGNSYGPAGFDFRHNLLTVGTVMTPFGHDGRWLKTGVTGYLTGGWQLNRVISRLSGMPLTVTASTTSLNARSNLQVANQMMPHVAILCGHGTNHPYFDPNAFAPVTDAALGNFSRDEVRGRGFFDMDTSLYRTFPLRERFKLQFRADAFGLTNTPQFALPTGERVERDILEWRGDQPQRL